MTKHQTPATVGDKAIDEWDAEWDAHKGGLRERHHQLDGLLGLYRLTLNGETVAIGTGTDIKQGIPKRLYDFHRRSPSGRNHHAGQLIYQYRDQLEVQVLIVGVGREAQRIARQLKPLMVGRHRPVWNVMLSRPKVKADQRKAARPTAPTSHIRIPTKAIKAVALQAA